MKLKSGLFKREVFYARKLRHVSVRVDEYTYRALLEVSKLLNTSISEVVRASVWYMLVLVSPGLTVRKAFRKEALEVIEKGGDVPLIVAFKNFSELMNEVLREKES